MNFGVVFCVYLQYYNSPKKKEVFMISTEYSWTLSVGIA